MSLRDKLARLWFRDRDARVAQLRGRLKAARESNDRLHRQLAEIRRASRRALESRDEARLQRAAAANAAADQAVELGRLRDQLDRVRSVLGNAGLTDWQIVRKLRAELGEAESGG